MNLTMIPFISVLHDGDEIGRIVGKLTRELGSGGISVSLGSGRQDSPSAVAFAIITGGTERLALDAIGNDGDPVLLLAHTLHNSLPAALEIAATLHQRGRKATIFLLGGREGSLEELKRHISLQETRARLMQSRIGLIGGASEWLTASSPDPETVRAAWGPLMVPLEMEEFLKRRERIPEAEYVRVAEDFLRGAGELREARRDDIMESARLYCALRRTADKYSLQALTIRCFDLLAALGATGCLGLSRLNDEGVVAGCEGDVPATLTMLWAYYLTGKPSFMANPQDISPGESLIEFAHCTVPLSLVKEFSLRSHFESSQGAALEGTFENGPVTVARVGGLTLKELFVTDGELITHHPREGRCRTQATVRTQEPPGHLLSSPLGNHHLIFAGHHAGELREFHKLYIKERTLP
ncbi:MAG: fucose isomerase [Candidatus Eremiobacteraeota bacterium]|nr:fucose isomerase [Candidatus Eremiobacteraeota bacterium]